MTGVYHVAWSSTTGIGREEPPNHILASSSWSPCVNQMRRNPTHAFVPTRFEPQAPFVRTCHGIIAKRTPLTNTDRSIDINIIADTTDDDNELLLCSSHYVIMHVQSTGGKVTPKTKHRDKSLGKTVSASRWVTRMIPASLAGLEELLREHRLPEPHLEPQGASWSQSRVIRVELAYL